MQYDDVTIQLDKKLSATLRELSNGEEASETIVRAIALLKVATEGVAAGKQLCLIDVDTRTVINLE